jgi:fructose-bisphosphate aldolase, class II
MTLVPMKEMLADARRNKYAVGSFDAFEYLAAEAILTAAGETGTPVILAVPGTVCDMPGKERFFSMILEASKASPVPVCLLLDHGTHDQVVKFIHYGFSAVMIDASALPYDQNVEITRKVVKMAEICGISVEAEIGHIPHREGPIETGHDAYEPGFTDPETAARFVQDTGVDALAVAVGTVHGLYRSKPNLDLERLRKISACVDIPLVMHGGTGVGEDGFRAAIANGISKVNIATDLSLTGVHAIEKLFEERKGNLHFYQIQEAARNSIAECVKDHIRIFGTPPIM